MGSGRDYLGDPAVLVTLKERGLQMRLHWDGEMTATNAETANFWKKHGAVRAVLARELNLEEIKMFRKQTDMEIQVQVHGITNIYHSMRRLVTSYMDHLGRHTPDISTGRNKACIWSNMNDADSNCRFLRMMRARIL